MMYSKNQKDVSMGGGSLRPNKKLPDFIIIGGMKCGTSSLFEYLRRHPQLSGSRNKEPGFFAENWDKGLNWYTGNFRNTNKLQFEASTNYTQFPRFAETPRRIAETLPGVLLVYLIRNPVDRAVSHVHHMLTKGYLAEQEVAKPGFWEERAQRYISVSSYYMQIKQYLDFFAKEQLLVVTLEEMKANKESFFNRVSEFLQIQPTHFKSVEPRTYNESGLRMKHEWPYRISYRLYRMGVLPPLYRSFADFIPKPLIVPETREYLVERLAEDHHQLCDFIGYEPFALQ